MPSLAVNSDGSPHIHEFVRVQKTNSYRCAHPQCYTVYHKKVLKGKESICGACHKNKIILTFEELRRAVPRCLDCSGTNKALEIQRHKEILREMGIV